jgi:antiphage defense system Thoeris ThsB-like protein
MGGGGGRSSSSLGDTRHLEDRAKEILQQGDTGRKNVFISFAYEDLDAVNLLRGQAKNENTDIEFNDLSVKEPFDSQRGEYIRQKIRERINQSSTTVVYLSKDTARSEWVKWEVEKSNELGKRIIATHSGGTPPTPLPDFIEKNKIKVVPWSSLATNLKKK